MKKETYRTVSPEDPIISAISAARARVIPGSGPNIRSRRVFSRSWFQNRLGIVGFTRED